MIFYQIWGHHEKIGKKLPCVGIFFTVDISIKKKSVRVAPKSQMNFTKGVTDSYPIFIIGLFPMCITGYFHIKVPIIIDLMKFV